MGKETSTGLSVGLPRRPGRWKFWVRRGSTEGTVRGVKGPGTCGPESRVVTV